MAICVSETGAGFGLPQGDAGGGVVACRSDTPTPAAPAGGGMGVSVTPHAQISPEGGWRVLAVGVDSLDLGLYVDWGPDWEKLRTVLQEGKEKASGTDGLSFRTRAGVCLILPCGWSRMHRYHLQTTEFHMGVGISHRGEKSPNVYVSLNCATLRAQGVTAAVADVVDYVRKLGGKVRRVKPSRCDLAVDVLVPGGLTSAFLEAYGVGRSGRLDIRKERACLETFYVGAMGSPILLRIYDKSKEIKASGKEWFKEVWGYNGPDVWRIEYQFRRTALKQFGVHSVEMLQDKVPGMWKYGTGGWYSLREPDNANASRRSVYAPWRTVQECAAVFGEVLDVRRNFETESCGGVQFHVARGAGSLVSYAAHRGLTERGAAAEAFAGAILGYLPEDKFREKYARRAIQYGRGVVPEDGGHEEPNA